MFLVIRRFYPKALSSLALTGKRKKNNAKYTLIHAETTVAKGGRYSTVKFCVISIV